MKPCRTCHQPWDAQGSLFTVCPSCRAKMPVRRVNGAPLNRRWRPLTPHPEYAMTLINTAPMHPDFKRIWSYHFGRQYPHTS